MSKQAWFGINILCAAIYCGWLGTIAQDGGFDLQLLGLTAVFGAIWGGLQQIYLRDTDLNASLFWPVASAVSWIMAAPFTILVLQTMPDRWENLQEFYEGAIGEPNSPIFGLIAIFGAIIFYSLISGFQSLPHHLYLWRKGKKETGWAGVAGLGWGIGLSLGVAIMVIVAILFSRLFNQPLPLSLPIRAALAGAIAGWLYALYIEIGELDRKEIEDYLEEKPA